MSRILDIVVPVYNERDLLPKLLARVEAVVLPPGVERRVIIVDDASTDGTRQYLRDLSHRRPDLIIDFHDHNRGKGAALRTGFAHARGDFVLIQDADLEYDPADYPQLIAPLLDGRADAVFGSRFLGQAHRVLYYWHSVGNKVLTTLSNMFSNLNLTDMECCYKVLRRSLLEEFKLEEERFGIEPELTAKLARLKARVYEVPISYAGRTYEEGKKITWRDGVSALRCILRYNLRPQTPPQTRPEAPPEARPETEPAAPTAETDRPAGVIGPVTSADARRRLA